MQPQAFVTRIYVYIRNKVEIRRNNVGETIKTIVYTLLRKENLVALEDVNSKIVNVKV